MRFLVNVTLRAISIPVGEMDKSFHTKTVTFKPRKPIQLDDATETEVLKNGKRVFDSGEIIEIPAEKAEKLLQEWEDMKSERNTRFMNHSDKFLATAARFAREEKVFDEMGKFQPIEHYVL